MTARVLRSPATAAPAVPTFATATPAAAVVAARAAASSSTPTTVPVYVPGYPTDEWSLLRGSIVGSVTSGASGTAAAVAETTYTIFCNDQSSSSCELADELPFVFAEGPSTLHYTGEAPGSITAELACVLNGTTAATCTGYTSYGPALVPDQLSTTGSETSWTSTFSDSAVQWGVLTLSVPPSSTDGGLDVTANTPTDTGAGDVVPTSGFLYTTASATSAAAARQHASSLWLSAAMFAAATACLVFS